MTYSAREASTRDGRIVELYELTIGSVVHRWTTANSVQIHLGLSYRPASIGRTPTRIGPDRPGSEMELEVPLGDPDSSAASSAWVLRAPDSRAVLRVYRRHVGDVETVLHWIGTVASVAYDDNRVRLLCRGLSDLLTRTGPRRTWGPLCPHVLYGAACGLAEASYRQSSSVVSASASGVSVTVGTLTGLTDGELIGGKLTIQATNESRLIITHVGSVLGIQYPFASLPVSTPVFVTEGCDHTITDCNAQFNNAANFGGFPYTPVLNPFTKSLDFF